MRPVAVDTSQLHRIPARYDQSVLLRGKFHRFLDRNLREAFQNRHDGEEVLEEPVELADRHGQPIACNWHLPIQGTAENKVSEKIRKIMSKLQCMIPKCNKKV